MKKFIPWLVVLAVIGITLNAQATIRGEQEVIDLFETYNYQVEQADIDYWTVNLNNGICELEECLQNRMQTDPQFSMEITGYEAVEFDENIIGASIPRRPTEFSTSIGEQKTEGHSDTTLKVTSITTKDGNTLSASVLGDLIVLSVNPGASNSETVSCTGLTVSTKTFTGCTFGFRFDDPTATQAGNIKAHAPGEPVIISNTDTYLSQQYPTLDGDATITGNWTFNTIQTFNQYPEILSALGDATTTRQVITLGQAQGLANQGSATSTELISGISILGTRIQNASSTPFGVLDPHIQQSQHASSTPSSNISSLNGGLWDIWSDNTGKLAQGWLDLIETYIWSGGHIWNTASSTFAGNLNISGDLTVTGDLIGGSILTISLNAGETIDGTTNPVPVYIKRSDGELYKTDADIEDLQSGDVIGVVTNSTTNGNSATLVDSGFLSMSSQTLTNTISETIDQKYVVGGAVVLTMNDSAEQFSNTFRVGQNVGNITKIDSYMKKSGSPTGNATMDIFAVDGDGKPTGSTLGTSNTVDVSGWDTNELARTFTFSTPVEVTPGQQLAFVIDTSAVTYSGGTLVQNGLAVRDGYSYVGEPTEKTYNSTDTGGSWSLITRTARFTTYYTQQEYSFGDNLWLSSTAGLFTLIPPTSGVPLIKVGEMMSQTLMKVDSSKKSKFLGSISTISSAASTVNISVPPGTYEVVVDMRKNDTNDTGGQVILRRNEIISIAIDADALTITASWDAGEGNINVTAGADTNVTTYFYSY